MSDEIKIKLESLSFRQALKYLLLKQNYRHELDILKGMDDLDKLKDVELPEGLPFNLWIEPWRT